MINHQFVHDLPFHDLTCNQFTDLFSHGTNNRLNYTDNPFVHYLENGVNEHFASNKISSKYYNESDFNYAVSGMHTHLSIFHLNIRSLPKNSQSLVAYLNNLDHTFDVILLSEIGHSDVSHLSCILEDYNFDFVPSPTKCGGVGIFYRTIFSKQYVKKQVISSNMNCNCCHCQIEDIWIGLNIGNDTFCISACYRHPRGNISHFLESLERTLQLPFIPQKCIIGGDFNIDVLKVDTISICDDYTKIMLCNNFIPTITIPSRITHSSATLIDNIFVKLPNRLLDNKVFSGNLITDLSDHLPNFCIIEGTSNTVKDRPLVRFYNKNNFDKFIDSVNNIDMSPILNSDDANSSYDMLSNIVKSCHNTHFPLRRMSRKKLHDKPWITPGIKNSISKKNILYRKYITKPSITLKNKLSSYRRILQRIIKSTQATYYKNILTSRQTSSRNAWVVINKLVKGKTNTKSPSVDTISYKGSTYSKNIDIANAFNDYFSSVGDTLSQHINSSISPLHYLKQSEKHTIFLSPISVDEVLKYIHSLKPGKAPGIDGIPPKIVRSVGHILAPVLAHIFNLVFVSGIYPDAMKVAKVIPLFKKGDSTQPENYRPISLLCCFDKLLELAIDKRLRQFFNKNSSFYDFQFGFREGHSTSHALQETVNTIRSHLDTGENVMGLYLDLKKAFDTVDHTILLQKLYHYGVRGLAYNVISSYLSNRKQCMYVNGTYSKYLNINTGVPQGSVLGPLLFLIYVNDLHVAVPDVSTRLFADDTNVFLFDKDCQNLVQRSIQTLTKLNIWFDSNKLTLHLGKTSYTIFHASDKSHPCCENFMFKGVKICQSPTTKYLGLYIDDKLSWASHINYVRNSLVKFIGIFYHLRNFLPESTAIQIYYSFIYSKIKYAIEIYGTAKASLLKPLQVLQNKLLKLLSCKPLRYPTNILHIENNLLMVNDIHTFSMGCFIYKYCNNMLPSAISNKVSCSIVANRHLETRNSRLFNVTHHNTLHGKLLMNNYCFTIWQSLPVVIKSAKSLKSFQKKLKNYLLNKYTENSITKRLVIYHKRN